MPFPLRPQIQLYNTLSRKKEVLRPIRKTLVRLYTCGPTVYNFAHIGNLRTYIFEDILERVLLYAGYNVRRVMNITDVGHLTGDADSGEDKVEEEAKKEKKSPEQVAKFYTRAFLSDLRKLNIRIPRILAPATAYVREQINLIKALARKGYTYETESAVYFDVAKFKTYGKLSGQSLTQKIVAARKEVVRDLSKKSPADFALWFKLSGRFKHHLMHWPSPWDEGFPGWHIECSAISRHFLGQPFDIHTGGVDHIGTHHENEIAQSEAAYGKPLAHYWLHGEHLVIHRSRMGKSEGNLITLSRLTAQGYAPLAFRYLVLTTHYRSKLNFTWQSLRAARAGMLKLYSRARDIWSEAQRDTHAIKPARVARWEKKFREALANDLNTPRALAVLGETMRTRSLVPKEKKALVQSFDTVLGLAIGTHAVLNLLPLPSNIKELVAAREEYRTRKQFMQADRLRKEINRLGYTIEDTPKGPLVWLKKPD